MQSFGCTHTEKIDENMAVLLPKHFFLLFHQTWPCSLVVVNKRKTAEGFAPQRVDPVLRVYMGRKLETIYAIVNYETCLQEFVNMKSWTRKCMSVPAEQHCEHEA